MRRTEQVQGLRLMKFEEVYGRTHRGGLSQAEAAEVLGVSERTFRRWRDRYEAEGADGLYDRRLVHRRGARRWTRWRGCWSCSTPATGTSRPSTSTRRAVLHQSPDKRGVPLPVKMVSQLTQTWHSQVRSFC